MKGNLSQFEAKINGVINNVYKNNKNVVEKSIGYIPKSIGNISKENVKDIKDDEDKYR